MKNDKKNIKCYIAGKISGIHVDLYTDKFNKAKQEVIDMGYDPVSPLDLPHNHGKSWSEYVREDLIALLGCTHIYALKDWRDSPGATIEVNIAIQVGINVIHQ